MLLESFALLCTLSTSSGLELDFVSAISRAKDAVPDGVFLAAKVADAGGGREFEIEFVKDEQHVAVAIGASDGALESTTSALDAEALTVLRPLVERVRNDAKITPEHAIEIATGQAKDAVPRQVEVKIDAEKRLVFAVELRSAKLRYAVVVEAARGDVVAVSEETITATKATVYSFDDLAIGTLPAGFEIAGTQQDGPLATWIISGKSGADDKEHTLRLVRRNHDSGSTFNLCWNRKLEFRDGTISVRLRADAGEDDQGGGLIWRALDHDNYYIVRFNPLESNLRVYSVKSGKRSQLGSADVPGKSGTWYELRVEHAGKRIRAALDGKFLLDVEDDSFPQAGGVGLWTKADAATSFDDLSIEPRGN